MYDVAINLLEAKFVDYTVTGNVPQRTGNRFPYVTPFDTFRTSDGHVMIICVGDQPFRSLCEAMDQPELAEDERFNNLMARNANAEALKEVIEDWSSKLSTSEAWDRLYSHAVPGAPVHDVKEVVEHPHTKERGMLVELEQPGAGKFTIFGPAMKAAGSEIKARGPAPLLGQDNRWLLTDVLDKDEEEASEIIASGAMGPEEQA